MKSQGHGGSCPGPPSAASHPKITRAVNSTSHGSGRKNDSIIINNNKAISNDDDDDDTCSGGSSDDNVTDNSNNDNNGDNDKNNHTENVGIPSNFIPVDLDGCTVWVRGRWWMCDVCKLFMSTDYNTTVHHEIECSVVSTA